MKDILTDEADYLGEADCSKNEKDTSNRYIKKLNR